MKFQMNNPYPGMGFKLCQDSINLDAYRIEYCHYDSLSKHLEFDF